MAPIVRISIVVAKRRSKPGRGEKGKGGEGRGRVTTISTNARGRYRRPIGPILRQSRRSVQRSPTSRVRSNPQRRAVCFSRYANGWREEFIVYVASGGVEGRSNDSRRPDDSVKAGYGRTRQRERYPVQGVEWKETAVQRPDRFGNAGVGGHVIVWQIHRREETDEPIGADRHRRVPFDFGIDRQLAAKDAGVENDGRKGRSDVIFNGDVATDRGARIFPSDRRTAERDVCRTRQNDPSEYRVQRREIR